VLHLYAYQPACIISLAQRFGFCCIVRRLAGQLVVDFHNDGCASLWMHGAPSGSRSIGFFRLVEDHRWPDTQLRCKKRENDRLLNKLIHAHAIPLQSSYMQQAHAKIIKPHQQKSARNLTTQMLRSEHTVRKVSAMTLTVSLHPQH
jgi:hypothetical protein